jgi:hypothetical protein
MIEMSGCAKCKADEMSMATSVYISAQDDE